MPKKTKIKVKKQKTPTKNKNKNIQNVKVIVSSSGGSGASGGSGGPSLRPQPYIIQQPQQPYIIQQPNFTPTNIRNENQQPNFTPTNIRNEIQQPKTEPQEKQNINWANVPIFDPFENDYDATIEPDIIQSNNIQSNNNNDDFITAFRKPENNDNKTLSQKIQPSAPPAQSEPIVTQNISFKPINNDSNKSLLQRTTMQEMSENPLFVKQITQNNAETLMRDKDIGLNRDEGPGGAGAGPGGAGLASRTIKPDTYISQAQSGSYVFTPPKGLQIDGQKSKTYKFKEDAYAAREQFLKDNNIKYEIKN